LIVEFFGESKMLLSRLIFVCAIFLGISSQAKLALIYRGPGSCPPSPQTTGCSEAAAMVARQSGYEVKFIGPLGPKDPGVWKQAQVWIQPGGLAKDQILAMHPLLLAKIRSFVRSGRGYVGFCAGAFLAARQFGFADAESSQGHFEAKALGLIPTYAHYYDLFDGELTEHHQAKILPTLWNLKLRHVYWELGPYFEFSKIPSDYSVVAYYQEALGRFEAKRIMAMRGRYGKGRVFVSAVHPEAPADWRKYYGLQDPEGTEQDLAQEMIRWAAKESE